MFRLFPGRSRFAHFRAAFNCLLQPCGSSGVISGRFVRRAAELKRGTLSSAALPFYGRNPANRIRKVKVVPQPPRGRRGVAGFYAHHFSVTRLCDGDAYLLSVAALLHLCSCSWLIRLGFELGPLVSQTSTWRRQPVIGIIALKVASIENTQNEFTYQYKLFRCRLRLVVISSQKWNAPRGKKLGVSCANRKAPYDFPIPL